MPGVGGKIETTDEEQGDFNHIFHSSNPSTQQHPNSCPSLSSPPLTDHPLNFTACCCCSLMVHLTPAAWLRIPSCSFSVADPCLIYTWWTHWWMFTRQKCVYIQKWALGVYCEGTYMGNSKPKCIKLFTHSKLLSSSKLTTIWSFIKWHYIILKPYDGFLQQNKYLFIENHSYFSLEHWLK